MKCLGSEETQQQVCVAILPVRHLLPLRLLLQPQIR